MKKYKLVKEYPGSLKLGSIATAIGGDDLWKGSTYYEKYPEYWEEVVEEDYEILKTCPIEGIIYSVKRVSDGEVSTIGDKARTFGSQSKHIIRQFRVKQKCFGRNFSGEYTYDGIDRIWIDWEINCGGNWLESTEKLRQPVFVTHDDKVIFEGDIVWYINKNIQFRHVPSCFIATPTIHFHTDINAYFLTAEDADNYFEESKVLFITEDGVGIKKDEVVYVVDRRLNSIDMISNFTPKDYPTFKAFSNSKIAEDYIVQHKYALSIEDFWEYQSWGGSTIAKSKRLKRLVKERLNLK